MRSKNRVSIPYKRVTNKNWAKEIQMTLSEFQSPISGSQTMIMLSWKFDFIWVSIPYKRVTNEVGTRYSPLCIVKFQSPISGSQTFVRSQVENQSALFQSPISGSQTQSVAQEEPEITVFQSPISGSQTVIRHAIFYGHSRVSIPYKRVTNDIADPAAFMTLLSFNPL